MSQVMYSMVMQRLKYTKYLKQIKISKKSKQKRLKITTSVQELDKLISDIKRIDNVVEILKPLISYFRNTISTGNRDKVVEDELMSLLRDAES